MEQIVEQPQLDIKKELTKLLKSNQKAKTEAAKAKEDLDKFVKEHQKKIFEEENIFLSEYGTIAQGTKTDFSCKSLTWGQLEQILNDADLKIYLKKRIPSTAVKAFFDTSEMKNADAAETGSLTRLREKFKVSKFTTKGVIAYKS